MDPIKDPRLEFIHKLTAFGAQQLGLFFGSSFQTLTKNQPPTWLYASLPYRIESILSYDGCPFLGSFHDRTAMETLAETLQQLGFDVYLFTAEGYGGDCCPIFPLLLEQTRARQAHVVLHEGLHITARKHEYTLPYELEEPLAITSADKGTELFAREHGDSALLQTLATLRETRHEFQSAINEGLALLTECYRTYPAEHAEAEARRNDALSSIRKNPVWQQAPAHGVMPMVECKFQEINNAFFVRYRSYYEHLAAVSAAADHLGSIEAILNFFKKLPPDMESALPRLNDIH